MANNVIAGQRFYAAKINALFSNIPELTSNNIDLIYWLDENGLFQVYIPGSGFNTLTRFIVGECYQIAAKVPLDLSTYIGYVGADTTLSFEQFLLNLEQEHTDETTSQNALSFNLWQTT